eukprot:SAG22_NODE_3824_length_1513_cov_1.938472_2_plen_266_part_01
MRWTMFLATVAAAKRPTEHIAAFQLIRGDYAWMGYSWQGCAGVDHKRPYYEFPGGAYKCPQNRSLDCSGYVDGAKWEAPKDWDPKGAMQLDFGGDQKPVDRVCKEVADGVFERKFAKLTVMRGLTATRSMPASSRQTTLALRRPWRGADMVASDSSCRLEEKKERSKGSSRVLFILPPEFFRSSSKFSTVIIDCSTCTVFTIQSPSLPQLPPGPANGPAVFHCASGLGFTAAAAALNESPTTIRVTGAVTRATCTPSAAVTAAMAD